MAEDPEKNSIIIRGAKVNNLKNIHLSIPRNQLIVITGLSGSGKSSLAFDTIYAEGQRRYVESLSAYARQFLGRIHKPEVDFIDGIPPAIAIEQKVNTRNPRSTVGTSTEIYDYLKLLYARIGVTYSPISGEIVKKDSVTDVVNYILSFDEGKAILILAPLKNENGRQMHQFLELLLNQGTSRIEINGKVERLDDVLKRSKEIKATHKINVVIDRVHVSHDEDSLGRYADSVQTAFNEGHGDCIICMADDTSIRHSFSNRFERDGMLFEEPNEHMFSFNSPYGACTRCEGYGKIIGIDEELVIPDKALSVYGEAVACWKGESMSYYKDQFIQQSAHFNFPIHKPYSELTDEQRDLLWNGNKQVDGINAFFAYLEEKKYKIQNRVMIARYSGKTTCPDCKGSRLRKDAGYVKVAGKSVQELVLLPVNELYPFFKEIHLNEYQKSVAQRILIEITNRLEFLVNVGLSYLALNRLSSTLSGGESQRINLATSLGSSLVGSLYVLDEPSIGLHSRDTELLISVLQKLQSLGNSVLVVEHDEEIMRAADQLIDIGPLAGRLGGEVVFQGKHQDLEKSEESLTAQYLTGKEKIAVPRTRRKWNNYIEVAGARENNLKRIDVRFPLNVLCVVTGVSGSGKSTLVRNILYASVARHFNGYNEKAGAFDTLRGDIKQIKAVEMVDQNPIGKSSRSNPVTYCKAYDEIRKLYSEQPLSVQNNLKPAHFSFNVEGGRCEECQGEGEITVEMQFMADVKLVCESCHGKRFKDEILEVRYRGKNINDILDLTVDEAIEFFGEKKNSTEKKIVSKIQPLQDVGLGYIKLGQSSSTLSGGESQRVKLASFLTLEKADQPTLFIFDEPTTGLHFHDIRKLLDAFHSLIEHGHSILVIEHNMEIIKCADWIIDLGPEGGKQGGYVVFEGTPEEIVNCEASYTGKYLKEKI
ncbi:MAG TPA: excinuclease ABC subunit UvrA [Bacteroidales bacterium]|nr:excinuclease ABC subunit UvrA [Bacteroidales bacterium]